MAVRQPLYLDSGNIKEMTTAMVTQIVNQVVYQYSINPSVVLSVVGSGGTLGTITDTRLQAGAISNSSSSFPNEATMSAGLGSWEAKWRGSRPHKLFWRQNTK